MNTLLTQDAATPPHDSNTRLIPLTKGKFAIVDAADFEWLNQWKWQAHLNKHRWYAQRATSIKGKKVGIQMHRAILNAPDGIQVDHKDCDGLNNSRSNLRLATNTQNQGNRILNRNSKSGIKGVYRSRSKWAAGISINGRHHWLGSYDTKEEAASAYLKSAREVFGEFARHK